MGVYLAMIGVADSMYRGNYMWHEKNMDDRRSSTGPFEKNAMATDTSKKSQDLTIARRLITVAVSDFLCWFPIGLLGLMAAMGVSIPAN
nr:hypothetical protein BaRGS_005763 [Batillaria attramentaria]